MANQWQLCGGTQYPISLRCSSQSLRSLCPTSLVKFCTATLWTSCRWGVLSINGRNSACHMFDIALSDRPLAIFDKQHVQSLNRLWSRETNAWGSFRYSVADPADGPNPRRRASISQLNPTGTVGFVVMSDVARANHQDFHRSSESSIKTNSKWLSADTGGGAQSTTAGTTRGAARCAMETDGLF